MTTIAVFVMMVRLLWDTWLHGTMLNVSINVNIWVGLEVGDLVEWGTASTGF